MAKVDEFKILVATDGSLHAKRAIDVTLQVPWPDLARARAVVARPAHSEYRQSALIAALDRGAALAARSARRRLSRRWPYADVAIVDKTPIEGVLGEAARFGADVIVVGWRGHGAVRRLLMGSVSRGIVRGARCAVLVVRDVPADMRRIVIGVDGSENADRAVAFVARLKPPKGGLVTLFSAAVPMVVPANALAPATVRRTIAQEIKRINTTRVTAAKEGLKRATATLTSHGWSVGVEVTTGAPLRDLLATATKTGAGVVVVGARGTANGRFLLGSVSDGLLNRCPVPVLVVR